MAKIPLSEIVNYTNGKTSGELNTIIQNVAKIEEAKDGDISFVSNPKYIKYLLETNAAAVFVDKNLKIPDGVTTNLVLVDDPYFAVCITMDNFFNPFTHPSEISEKAEISSTSQIGTGCYIGSFTSIGANSKIGNNVKIYPNCYIGENVIIKDDTVIFSNVSIYINCEIGSNTIIHSGTVIGCDGFGHAPMPDGSYVKIPQIGNVIVGSFVEIGSNCTIDRATMGSTIISDGVKLDNLIQIAHNVVVGKNTVIAAQTGISGSTKLGERCVIGGQVGFVGHIQIANGTQIGAQSGIMKTIKKENQAFLGSPIKPVKDEIKSQVLIRKLPEIYDDINKLKKDINT